MMYLVGFLVPTVFVPGWTGAGLPTAWPFLSIVLPFFLLRPIPMSEAHWWGLAFLVYAFISLLWTPILVQGVEYVWHLCILGAAFALGSVTSCPRRLYIGLGLGITVSSLLAIPQWLGWDGIYLFAGGIPAGLFINANALGEAAAVVILLLLTERIWWLIPGVLPGIILTQARGAALALALALGAWAWGRSRLVAIAVVIALAAAGTYASLRKESNYSFGQRLAIWTDTFSGLTTFGHGAGSFIPLYPHYADRQDTLRERPENAHNEFLETLFHFGIGACFLWFLCIQTLSRGGPETYAFFAFLVVASIGFALATPVTAFMGAFVAGRLNRSRDDVGVFSLGGRSVLYQRMGRA